ncbi:MAG: NADH-quinone oxidoreductase subunit K [Bradymonadaceae bacterium]|nr:NADH-quinone oxidoreductase subunit K [Lujinxingiaceae bacterium]
MTPSVLYALAGVLLFVGALYTLIIGPELVRRIMAFNIMGSGVFLVLIAFGARQPDAPTDPVPQAMVLTGVVVAVSATAVALALARHIHALSGHTRLPEDSPSDSI